MATVWKFRYAKQKFNNHGLIVQQILRLRNTLGYIVAVSSPKCKKCSVMLLKVERIRCKQLSGALEAERFARPSV